MSGFGTESPDAIAYWQELQTRTSEKNKIHLKYN